jgi:hypothetical protein
VDKSLAALRSGRSVIVPGTLYAAIAAAAKLAPRALVRAVAARF